ncbi:NAD(P)/FAD-dependent oxidoreductase [Actinomycetospora endophytica]|uniref:NAD(P)/FAD-dependent oxidoreductase n=1 Tax=Actinomycetospora endophytica TaxID=2291215 RepID=A0ABS8P232_9PSEU|nr:NAD(P)/FAD-dependent oxidoreductase [Actinomycetospora endophytica]MCD2192118.1 NAD(P)/FAD-dependent oxidoreductase [Actinomycetospora endophytica]
MTDLDVAVIGAGFAGLAALHLLRERGLRVRAYDEAGNVGGTWWWHAYPGSHLDTDGSLYQYGFSEQLYRDWGWSERYPAGYEVQRWLRFVADRLDLRRDISLSTRIVSARHDGLWTLVTDRGGTVRARSLVACTGRLPVEGDLDVGGFGGLVVRTAAWPEDGHDLSGRRVGIVGTTTATVQLAPWIADAVAELTVVSDGPRDVVRRRNPVYGWQERDAYRARFAELRDRAPGAVAADREAMRARVDDPAVAKLLIPDGEAGRVALDDGWLELFARDGVALVPRSDVARVGPTGLELVDGTVVGLDVLVVPDEFDAGPPAVWGIDGVTADAPGLHTVLAPPGGGTVSFELMRRVEAIVAEVAPG